MSRVADSPGARIDRSWATLGLAVGDLLLIAVFVVAGELRHGYGLLAHPERVLGTAIPFFIGWVVVSILIGVYRRSVYTVPRTAALRTALAWVGAALVGQALRATELFHGTFAPAFLLVSLGVGLVLLVPWRAVAALWPTITAFFGRRGQSA